MKSKKNTFRAWLDREKLTTEKFAELAGVQYNTATKWCGDVVPRPFVRRTLREKFPTCPIFQD